MKETKPDVAEQSNNFYYKEISAKSEATVRSFISFIFDPNSFLSRLIAFDESCQNSSSESIHRKYFRPLLTDGMKER